jgi:hypothetical protein
VPNAEERVGIHQKLKIGFYFCERKALERRIRSQPWNKLAWLCFKRHRRINACFPSCHAHDFEDRFAVEVVVEPVLVGKEEIGHESQIKLAVRER